jgi:hypothetical protein
LNWHRWQNYENENVECIDATMKQSAGAWIWVDRIGHAKVDEAEAAATFAKNQELPTGKKYRIWNDEREYCMVE